MNNQLQTSNNVAGRDLLATVDYEGLGLSAHTDAMAVRQMADRIQPSDPATVAEFGRDVGAITESYSDSLLEQVRNSDLDDAGDKLTQVVNVARNLNVGPLSDRRSRVPLVGPFIDRMRMRAGNFKGKFESTRAQIDTLLAEVGTTQGNLQQRNAGLEEMFIAVTEERRMLGIHIAAGRIRVAELRAEADALRATVGNDPARVQQLADLDMLVASLDKRVGDLQAMQHAAIQALPMIRMLQSNNRMLVDKFHTIRQITVPAWKRQFMLSLTLNEQKNAVQLADTIDETTNSLLKSNAELLHRNSVATAKANQRLVIDVETLASVQQTLIGTVEEVIRIQRDGAQQRQQAVKQIEVMREGLRTAISRRTAASSAPMLRHESE
ncbi:toxic anion resistance protein [Stenotrophomonas maltophilia]|uniref:toxic anion resistance protein n=1 Tax=Stenotrophomonas maltophilia TaxID=40324 RepID=UPI0029055D77|nr:toxic anion resistance protein [Stenotrophomonas maltophilia]MCU1144360.1 toxic anion resistance protein [Stenotrophomonas maltophilia]